MSIDCASNRVTVLHYSSLILMSYLVKELFQQQVVHVKTVNSTSDGELILTALII